jgi:membrane fusion protein, multidrug efflux system
VNNRIVTVAIVIASLAGVACSKGADASKGADGGRPGQGGPPSAFPVEVQPVAIRNVEYTVNATGAVEAFETVAVTARVAGAVERVRFMEGQNIAPGTVLVEIEPERYRLAVQAAEANMQKAVASQREAEAALARRESANERNRGLIPGEEIETWRTRVRTASAEVGLLQAAVQQARLNLRDAFVRAPVGGTIQTRTVQTGQYVPVGSVLATLVRRDPLLLRFQVPEQESASLRRGMPVRFTVAEGSAPYTARIALIGEQARTETRMVDVTANVIDRNQAALKPGAFAQVVIPIGAATNAPVIPQTAIRPSEKGFLAYVVEDGKAAERTLILGLRTADGQVEVKSGLQPGEALVVRGTEALTDGAPVKVEKQMAPPAAARG